MIRLKENSQKTDRKGTGIMKENRYELNKQLAQMLKGGVIMDVTTPEQAKIAEEAGACAVMALERIPADIRAAGGVSRMSDPKMIRGIQEAVSIPVMAKCRIGHFVEAQILEAIEIDYIDESEVLSPADDIYHINKKEFKVPFVCGARDLGEALRRIAEGASMIRTKGEPGTGDVVQAVRHMRAMNAEIRRIQNLRADDELKTLTADIETIRKIEEQIAEIEKKNTGSDNTDQKNSSNDTSPFKNFSGQDYDGNSVDESLFSKNAVTVINFWFTGCKPCVAELSKLNELNDAIKSMGGEVVGINTETFDGNKTAIKEAKTLLKSQGAKYRNLSIDSSSDAGKYASDIMAFPTTILVDRNGNIVGDPMLGGIDNQDNYDTLMKQIQSVIDADSTKK